MSIMTRTDYYLTIISLLIVSASACRKGTINPPIITTIDATEITSNTAFSGGVVVYDKASDISSYGVCWSLNPDPSINDKKTIDGAGVANFTSLLKDLYSDTLYYIRAYASTHSTTAYGLSLQFRTTGIPNADINITIYPNSTIYWEINFPYGWIYIIGAPPSRGLLVYRKSSDEFIAYERTCSHDPSNLNARIEFKSSSNPYLECINCGSTFSLHDGHPIVSPSNKPLKQYQTSYNGNALKIYSQ